MHCSSIWSLTHSSVIRKHSAISASLAFNVFSFITFSVVFPYCSILMHFAILAKQVSAFRHTLSSNTCWAPFKISVWISCVNDEGSSLFVFYATRGQYETILGLCMNFFFLLCMNLVIWVLFLFLVFCMHGFVLFPPGGDR